MNTHSVSPTNPTYVTGAEQYRVTLSALLTPEHPNFAQMEEFFSERRQPEGYGLLFLESEEHSVIHAGSADLLRAYQANPDALGSLDLNQGVNYGGWPHGTGWDDFIPDTTWNPGGEGIVTEFDHPLGGKVTVYEYIKTEKDGTRTPMVVQHCDRCHPGEDHDHEFAMVNRRPDDRRWMARNARVHVRSHTERCRLQNPEIMKVVTAVANEMHGTNNPVTSWESRCATVGPCARIRQFRALRAASER